MCGIVGIAGEPDAQLVRRMADVIVHRGPDGEGYFTDEHVSLGARRLSVIDIPGSDQPIANEDGTVVTVFNGEIYNYRDIRLFLQREGHRLRSAGDTEVLVHLYEEYGEAGVHRLRGMFAYAIWDSRRRRLVLVRDRVGIKPLYYCERKGRLVFASEIKALLAVPGIPREVDLEALDLYLSLQYVPGPKTMLRDIRKVPPGHLLVWEDGRSSLTQYWDLTLLGADRPVPEQAAVEEFRALLSETVALHRTSDVPVGALLSGGIDSSAIVAMMARSGERPKTFTVAFRGGGPEDELNEARRVALRAGTDHHEVVLGPDLAAALPAIVRAQDEPVADAAAVPTYFICRFAAEHVKVVLTGEGGDEALAGYPRYQWLALAERWSDSLLWSRGGPWLAAVVDRLAGATRQAQRLKTLAVPAPLGTRHLQWVGVLTDEVKARVLGFSSNGAAPDLVARWLAASGVESASDRLRYLDFKTWLPDDVLVKTDRMSMAASLEARVPLLDHRLLEFVATLPGCLLARGFQGKWLLRQALKPDLPRATVWRPKQAFQVPLGRLFAGPLREVLRDTLTDGTTRQRGVFQPRAVEALIDDRLPGWSDRSRSLWTLLWFELWCREYVDSRPAGHA